MGVAWLLSILLRMGFADCSENVLQQVKRKKTDFNMFVAHQTCTPSNCEDILDEVEEWYPRIPHSDLYLELARRSCSDSPRNWYRQEKIKQAINENACLF